MRTLKKSDTFNKTDNQYHYPQTPARVQLSLWPAGSTKNGEGTVAWSGGLIDWNAQDVKQNGYYYAMFKEVDVQCYDTPPGANSSGSTSYVYTNRNGTQQAISLTNNPTVLKSLLGNGEDLNKDYPKSSSTSSGAPAATSNVATIPGLTGAGPGTDGSRGGGSNGVSGSGSGGSQSSSAGGAASTGIGGFSQGTSQKGNGAAAKSEEVLQGSIFAVLVAFIGMLAI